MVKISVKANERKHQGHEIAKLLFVHGLEELMLLRALEFLFVCFIFPYFICFGILS